MATTKTFAPKDTITITNVGSEEVGFRYFRVNFVEVLQPEDNVVLTSASAEESAYYAALADEKVGLAVEVKAASEATE